MNIIQIRRNGTRAIARIDGDGAVEIRGFDTLLGLAADAIRKRLTLEDAARMAGDGARHDYAELLSNGAVLSPVDHPDPAHCTITGTGLTHLGSASARDEMHARAANATGNETDSIRMFNMGLKGGKPAGDGPGVQPEWFYKGDGSMLVAPGGDLPMPSFALDGGEEPEIAGIYLIGPDGAPHRLGFAIGNEYSDHVTEKQNYLYLAHSKLRCSSIGPELRTGPLPQDLQGESRIIRDGKLFWKKPFLTGEANMSHAVANLEYHHFKYPFFRRAGDLHIHYFGTSTLSVSDGIKTAPGDVFEIEMPGFGAPLRNRLMPVPEDFRYGGVTCL